MTTVAGPLRSWPSKTRTLVIAVLFAMLPDGGLLSAEEARMNECFPSQGPGDSLALVIVKRYAGPGGSVLHGARRRVQRGLRSEISYSRTSPTQTDGHGLQGSARPTPDLPCQETGAGGRAADGSGWPRWSPGTSSPSTKHCRPERAMRGYLARIPPRQEWFISVHEAIRRPLSSRAPSSPLSSPWALTQSSELIRLGSGGCSRKTKYSASSNVAHIPRTRSPKPRVLRLVFRQNWGGMQGVGDEAAESRANFLQRPGAAGRQDRHRCGLALSSGHILGNTRASGPIPLGEDQRFLTWRSVDRPGR